ncbi:MAG: hypothetical protein QM773_02720 [Hyphomonadaceae bacterium]
MKSFAFLAAAAAVVSLSACAAIRPAEMARPAALQAADSTPIFGIGGGETGNFTTGQNNGAFSRSATRLSFFELYNMRDGGSKFSLSGPDFVDGLEARCVMKERSVTIDIVEFKPAPMAYGCDFASGGQKLAAVFEVQETAPGFTNKQERRGRVMLDGSMLDIRSVHEIAGSVLPVSAPIGYVFERNGAAIGGIEINGDPVMFAAPGTSLADRRAIMLAAVALSVFWDPANLDA